MRQSHILIYSKFFVAFMLLSHVVMYYVCWTFSIHVMLVMPLHSICLTELELLWF